MQKTRRLHRLLAVLVAVLLAVCCLPVTAFAAPSTVSSHVYVTLKLDGDKKGEADFWLGDLPVTPGTLTTKCSWKQLYENLLKATTLPENTRIKDKHEEGDCTLDLRLLANETYRSDVTLELEPEYEIEFTIRYMGYGGADLGSHTAKVLYSPSTAPEAWAYVSSAEEFKALKAPLKELKIEQDGDKAPTPRGII